ncbi:MAG: formate dehydrogenase accessory sulfurtransferase FdhD [Candidatus Sericytochromatia bacterium]
MIPAGAYRSAEILRYRRNEPAVTRRDRLAAEEPLEIRLLSGPRGKPKSRSLTLTMRTPGQDYELAAGLLYSENLIRQPDDIVKMTYCVGEDKHTQAYNVLQVRLRPGLEVPWERLARHGVSHASCGLCGKVQIEQLQQELHPDFGPDTPRLDPELLFSLQEKMRPLQPLFERTGGVHASALFDHQGECLALCEDVGRHNALDKLIGKQLLAGRLPLLQHLVMVSGRTSFELVQKALHASLPVLIGVGAPSSLAVDLAQSYGQTLIGFLKPDGFNVYSGRGRMENS